MRATMFAMVVGAGLVLASVSLGAHHAFSAEYREDKPVKLRGQLTRMDWINPHCWIHLDVTRPDGRVESWMVEAGAPNALLRRGWTKNSLMAGTVVIVEGYRAKDGSRMVSGRDVTFADGRKLFAGSSIAPERVEKFEITAGWPEDLPSWKADQHE